MYLVSVICSSGGAVGWDAVSANQVLEGLLECLRGTEGELREIHASGQGSGVVVITKQTKGWWSGKLLSVHAENGIGAPNRHVRVRGNGVRTRGLLWAKFCDRG